MALVELAGPVALAVRQALPVLRVRAVQPALRVPVPVEVVVAVPHLLAQQVQPPVAAQVVAAAEGGVPHLLVVLQRPQLAAPAVQVDQPKRLQLQLLQSLKRLSNKLLLLSPKRFPKPAPLMVQPLHRSPPLLWPTAATAKKRNCCKP